MPPNSPALRRSCPPARQCARSGGREGRPSRRNGYCRQRDGAFLRARMPAASGCRRCSGVEQASGGPRATRRRTAPALARNLLVCTLAKPSISGRIAGYGANQGHAATPAKAERSAADRRPEVPARRRMRASAPSRWTPARAHRQRAPGASAGAAGARGVERANVDAAGRARASSTLRAVIRLPAHLAIQRRSRGGATPANDGAKRVEAGVRMRDRPAEAAAEGVFKRCGRRASARTMKSVR